MMKKIIPLITLALLTLLTACSNQKQAIELNDKLAAITREMEAQGLKLQPVMQQAASDGDFTRLAAPLQEVNTVIDNKIKEASALKDIAGSEAYTKSVRDLLNIEKKIVNQAFVPISKMNRNTPQDQLQAAFTNMQEIIREEQGAISNIKKAQEEFAKKNGFKILN